MTQFTDIRVRAAILFFVYSILVSAESLPASAIEISSTGNCNAAAGNRKAGHALLQGEPLKMRARGFASSRGSSAWMDSQATMRSDSSFFSHSNMKLTNHEVQENVEHVIDSTARKTSALCPLPSGAIWCDAQLNGITRKVAVYAGPDPVSNTICSKGAWEFSSVQDMGLKSGYGKTLVDIGANIGWFSFLFAGVGYKVFAIEPMVANRKLIQATLCQNPDLSTNIQIVPIALAQNPTKNGQTCDVYSCDCNVGDGMLVCDGEESRRSEIMDSQHLRHVWREAVKTKTLDQVMTDLGSPSVDVIKMDVEGYECKILEGGPQTFRKPNYIMAEVRANTTLCTVSPLTNYGFVAHSSTFAGAAVSQAYPGNGHPNLFFTRN